MIIRHFLFAFSGFSGVGKDECAKFLVNKYRALHSGLVDPAKRHMADIYWFSETQLFGPSESRNNGDSRYPKPIFYTLKIKPCTQGSEFDYEFEWNADTHKFMPIVDHSDKFEKKLFIKKINPSFFLSPREVLQKYCALMNEMYQYTWIQNAVELHQKMADVTDMNSIDHGKWIQKSGYSRMDGFKQHEVPVREKFHIIGNGVPVYLSCLSDIRHLNEIEFLKKSQNAKMTPVLIRVKRPGIETPPYPHKSETEQATIPDSDFDFIINNDSDISSLHDKVDELMCSIISM